MNEKKPPKPESMNFEQARQELERIIQRIEGGQVGLEESIGQYERGIQLINHCRSILSLAEQRITQLAADSQGNLRPVDKPTPSSGGGETSGGDASDSGGTSGGEEAPF